VLQVRAAGQISSRLVWDSQAGQGVVQHAHVARGRDAARWLRATGYGKDLSMYGFEDYTRLKHVMSAIAP